MIIFIMYYIIWIWLSTTYCVHSIVCHRCSTQPMDKYMYMKQYSNRFIQLSPSPMVYLRAFSSSRSIFSGLLGSNLTIWYLTSAFSIMLLLFAWFACCPYPPHCWPWFSCWTPAPWSLIIPRFAHPMMRNPPLSLMYWNTRLVLSKMLSSISWLKCDALIWAASLSVST